MKKWKVHFRIIAVRCTDCFRVYMHDETQNNKCPECGSGNRTTVK